MSEKYKKQIWEMNFKYINVKRVSKIFKEMNQRIKMYQNKIDKNQQIRKLF